MVLMSGFLLGIKPSQKEHAMKAIFSALALAIALACAAPAFAGDVTTAKNQADCQKAGGTWDDKMQTCSGKKM